MAKKDLRAQMDAARAAAAFIGAAQEKAQEPAEEAPVDKPRQEDRALMHEVKGEPKAEADEKSGPIEFFTLEDALNGSALSSSASDTTAKRAAKAEGVSSASEDLELPPDILPDDNLPAPGAATYAVASLPEEPPAPEATRSRASRGAGSRASAGKATTGRSTAAEAAPAAAEKPKAPRAKRGRKKAQPVTDVAGVTSEAAGNRMTAQVLVPMTAEQREHADLLAQVMKITRAEVMRQALDEYWDNHKSELQAAVAAYEELIRKLMS